MTYGRLMLATIGVALMVTGVVVAVAGSSVAGLGIIVIALFAVVLGLANWHEFEAQITRALKLRVAHASPPSPAPVEAPRADIRILGVDAQGGHSDAVDFRVEIVNYGDRQARCTVRATVNGSAVTVNPSSLDLIPNRPPESARVLVPRPALGDLMLPEIPSDPTTLYDRTLTVVVSDGVQEVTDEWHETVFDPLEDKARAEVQQRYWRRGRAAETEGDRRTEAIREREERIKRGDDDPDRYRHV